MKSIEYNSITGEITERELTAEEVAQMEAMQNIEPTEPQPTIEERVTDIEQVTTDVMSQKAVTDELVQLAGLEAEITELEKQFNDQSENVQL